MGGAHKFCVGIDSIVERAKTQRFFEHFGARARPHVCTPPPAHAHMWTHVRVHPAQARTRSE